MRRPTTTALGVTLAAALAFTGIAMLPGIAQGVSSGDKEVVLLNCRTDDQGIRTSAFSESSGVWDQDYSAECAQSVSELLRGGFDLEHKQVIEAGGRESFSFLFVRNW